MSIFVARQKPLMTAMVGGSSVQENLSIMNNALWNGAEAFYIQMEHLRAEDRNKEALQPLFARAEGRPTLITGYRGGPIPMTDEERAEYLLLGLESGANVCDVMGDYFAPAPNQLTEDKDAIRKQRELIDEIHRKGGEVLMSTHLAQFTPVEELLRIALEQQNRGADIVKIVTQCTGEEELQANINAIFTLKKELSCPFLFLTSGTYGRLLRLIGPALGVCMYLTVDHFTPLDFAQQPKLTRAVALRDILSI